MDLKYNSMNMQILLDKIGFFRIDNIEKLPKFGFTYKIDNENMSGIYWFYENENYIIDIHDFFAKKTFYVNKFPDVSDYIVFCSSYIFKSNCELLDPYIKIKSNTLFNLNIKNNSYRYKMKGNQAFYTLCISFKKNFLNELLKISKKLKLKDIENLFINNEIINSQIEKIAREIQNCRMEEPAISIFFDAKVKEWFSYFIDEVFKKEKEKDLPKTDNEAISRVENYILENYNQNIKQNTLEKIAFMSGTKLKNTFKKKNKITITEFTQKIRMDVAEEILKTNNIDIRTLSSEVGYTSPSRFANLFKRYKGLFPSELKKEIYEKKS